MTINDLTDFDADEPEIFQTICFNTSFIENNFLRTQFESDIQDADWLGPLASNKDLPETIKNNKGRNQYFMIPFILGLIGFFFQFNNWL